MALVKSQVSELKAEVINSPTQPNTKVVRATWKYSTSTSGDYEYFKSFDVTWKYSYGETTKTSSGKETIWYSSQSSVNRDTSSTLQHNDFSIPSVDPTKVKTISFYVIVKPTFNTKQVTVVDEDGDEKKEPVKIPSNQSKSGVVTYDTAESITVSVPSVTVEVTAEKKLKLTVTNYNYTNQKARSVEFRTMCNGNTDSGKTYKANISNSTASVTTSSAMAAGKYYQVRVRGWSEKNCKGKHSKWSSWSEKYYGSPKAPKGRFEIQVASRPAEGASGGRANVILYDEANTKGPDVIDSYQLQYTTVPNDFKYNRTGSTNYQSLDFSLPEDNSDDDPLANSAHYHFRGYFDTPSDISKKYYFRIRAKKGDYYSGWHSKIFEFEFGLQPAAPTVWFKKSTFKDSDQLIVYFTHNSKDGSKMKHFRLGVYVNEVEIHHLETTVLGTTTTGVDEEEATYQYPFGTIYDLISSHSELAGQGKYTVQVQIQTQGVAMAEDKWSPASSVQTITVWPQPVVEIVGTGTGDWLWDPFDFRYDTTETAFDGTQFSSPVTKFPIFIEVESGPAPQQAMYYTFQITSKSSYDAMNYDGTDKHINVGDVLYTKNILPTIKYGETENTGNYALLRINPWDILLENAKTYNLKVIAVMNSGLNATTNMDFETQFKDYDFLPDAEMIPDNNGYSMTIIPSLSDDTEYEDDEDPLTLSDIVFHIWRRNYDDSMTNIITGLTGDYKTGVIDPHPMMRGGLYRIVAMSKVTGEVTYIDIPSPGFDEIGIMIQWDEEYTDYEIIGEEDYEQDDRDTLMFGSGTGGSSLFLPYNIDVTNQYNMDAELVDYLGREHPVSYYGTQKGESMSLSTAIPKEGTEQIVLSMRRLSNYRGNCYIREPSGTGYWARIEISFNINHLEVTIPISITATRVEGGM